MSKMGYNTPLSRLTEMESGIPQELVLWKEKDVSPFPFGAIFSFLLLVFGGVFLDESLELSLMPEQPL